MSAMQHRCSSCRPCPSLTTANRVAFPDRLRISYQVTADRLQGELEFAYRTHWTHVLTTVLWGGRIDDASRRLLVEALHLAAGEASPVHLHVFAAATSDLFTHASHLLAVRHRDRAGVPDTLVPVSGAAPLHDGLLAAARRLRRAARLRPGVTVVVDGESADSLRATQWALQGVFNSMRDYLEQVLKPLTPHVSRDAIHAVILRTRREVNALAACRALGDVYAETLAVTESHDGSLTIDIEGSLRAATQCGDTQR